MGDPTRKPTVNTADEIDIPSQRDMALCHDPWSIGVRRARSMCHLGNNGGIYMRKPIEGIDHRKAWGNRPRITTPAERGTLL